MLPVNFSAGPAMLPPQVLDEIQAQLKDWHQGLSILEISHRSKPVLALQAQIKTLLTELLDIPDDFSILMMHGGARGQFAALPMNLAQGKSKASYLITGYWGEKAANACQPYLEVDRLSLDLNQRMPLANDLEISSDSAYLHLTENETIGGIELPTHSKLHTCVAADMTSSFLSKRIDWSSFDCIYASAQKNLGIAGCTYVFIRKSLLGGAHPWTPDVLNYQVIEESDSMINTPPVFCWYVTHKVLEWVKAQGGVDAMAQRASTRAQLLYELIDSSDLYDNPIPKPYRSRLNVPFTLKADEGEFFKQAKEAKLYFLEGHRSFGGARASLYNAMPIEGVERLVKFMKDFENRA